MSEHCDWTPAHLHWTTHNLGEVMPGVQTPLSFSVWQRAMDWASHNNAYELGAMSRAEGDGNFPQPLESPLLRQFYGRVGFQVEYFCVFGDRMPGTTGEQVCESILGHVPGDIPFHPTHRRVGAVAVRYPYVFATNPARVRREAEAGRAWYRQLIARLATADRRAATTAFTEATEHLERAVSLQALTLLGSIQPLWQAIEAIVARTGIGDAGLFSGMGGAEANLVRDIWRASRGQLTAAQVQQRHGFHGPVEGELSCHTWREDPTPLHDLIARYAAKDDCADPIALEHRKDAERREAVGRVLAATPRLSRPATRLALDLAATRIPLRGIAKETFLEAFDAARAAARRIGDLLVTEGALQEREDVFYLRKSELLRQIPRDVRELVSSRRELRDEHKRYVLPAEWKGTPQAQLISDGGGDRSLEAVDGVGVSDGIVEGTARVVIEPDFTEVQEGEILVAPFTDPGWASILFISSALVVDIGGALSHAAVVARELGIPAVVNTGDGTRVLRTGDRLRVDGSTGRVEVLQRAATSAL
jgi:phosphohistidine swiveling domain-containing protein